MATPLARLVAEALPPTWRAGHAHQSCCAITRSLVERSVTLDVRVTKHGKIRLTVATSRPGQSPRSFDRCSMLSWLVAGPQVAP